MRGAERVVHVDVGERGVAARQLRVVLGLSRLVADVLEHHEVAVGHVVERRRQRHLCAEQLAEALRRRAQRQPRLAILRPPEMGREQQPRAARAQPLDRRQRRADARVVRDPAAVERDVEVDPDEDALARHVEVLQRSH